MLFIGNIRDRLSLVVLDGEEYAEALQASAIRSIVGGAIYGAVIAHCAIKSKAQTIYTWNVRHYALCGRDVASRLRTP
jgi:hypothetical protein